MSVSTSPLAAASATAHTCTADLSVLAGQGTYFVYRMLDGIAMLATGVSRDIHRFDANGLFLARTLKTMLQHGPQLPPVETVVPATEALVNQLFHVCMTDRDRFAAALLLAWRTTFAALGDPDLLQRLDEAQSGMFRAFQRALDEYVQVQAPSPMPEFLEVQLLELSRLVHDELRVA